MNLGEYEKSEEDIKKLDELLPNDKNVKNLHTDMNNLKKEELANKKKFPKRGLFNLYDEKEVCKNTLPKYNKENKCFYIDVIINDDSKNPKKFKFEIFNETKIKMKNVYDELINMIDSMRLKNKVVSNVIDIFNFEMNDELKFPVNEKFLLCLRKKEIGYELFVNLEENSCNSIIIGRCYYNSNVWNQSNGDNFRIIDCDYTFNI
jgi:hypothetical protein